MYSFYTFTCLSHRINAFHLNTVISLFYKAPILNKQIIFNLTKKDKYEYFYQELLFIKHILQDQSMVQA